MAMSDGNRPCSVPIVAHFNAKAGDRIWTLWIEALRPNGQWIRLLYRHHDGHAWSPGVVVAEITHRDRVHCFLELAYDNDEEADALAEQTVDMLWTLAREKPPVDAMTGLRWRLRKWICDERRRAANCLKAA
jgi:hypothetical protein